MWITCTWISQAHLYSNLKVYVENMHLRILGHLMRSINPQPGVHSVVSLLSRTLVMVWSGQYPSYVAPINGLGSFVPLSFSKMTNFWETEHTRTIVWSLVHIDRRKWIVSYIPNCSTIWAKAEKCWGPSLRGFSTLYILAWGQNKGILKLS